MAPGRGLVLWDEDWQEPGQTWGLCHHLPASLWFCYSFEIEQGWLISVCNPSILGSVFPRHYSFNFFEVGGGWYVKH